MLMWTKTEILSWNHFNLKFLNEFNNSRFNLNLTLKGNFFSRYDYEDCDTESANKVMKHLQDTFAQADFVGKDFSFANKTYKVGLADDFAYTDPIDQSVSTKQGLRILFTDGSRVVFRFYLYIYSRFKNKYFNFKN